MTDTEKVKCETCGGVGMVGDLFPDETTPFAQGLECSDCDGKGWQVVEAEETPKERSKGALCFMAHYGGAKTLVCQVKGHRIVEIYEARGFVEVNKAEYQRIVKAMKENQKENN